MSSHDIDRLLAEAGAEVEAPAALRERVRGEIDRAVRRRRAIVSGASGALALGAAALLAVVWRGESDGTAAASRARAFVDAGSRGVEPAREVVRDQLPGRTPAPDQAAPAQRRATVRMTGPAHFAAPVRSSKPNVTIVRIYRDSTVETDPSEQEGSSRQPDQSTTQATIRSTTDSTT